MEANIENKRSSFLHSLARETIIVFPICRPGYNTFNRKHCLNFARQNGLEALTKFFGSPPHGQCPSWICRDRPYQIMTFLFVESIIFFTELFIFEHEVWALWKWYWTSTIQQVLWSRCINIEALKFCWAWKKGEK